MAMLFYPLAALSKIIGTDIIQTGKGFKVKSDEARFGAHLIKGVTLNVLDLKISSKDTNGELSFYEQKGYTPKGSPPLHIHLFQDEFFILSRENISFRWVTTYIR